MSEQSVRQHSRRRVTAMALGDGEEDDDDDDDDHNNNNNNNNNNRISLIVLK